MPINPIRDSTRFLGLDGGARDEAGQNGGRHNKRCLKSQNVKKGCLVGASAGVCSARGGGGRWRWRFFLPRGMVVVRARLAGCSRVRDASDWYHYGRCVSSKHDVLTSYAMVSVCCWMMAWRYRKRWHTEKMKTSATAQLERRDAGFMCVCALFLVRGDCLRRRSGRLASPIYVWSCIGLSCLACFTLVCFLFSLAVLSAQGVVYSIDLLMVFFGGEFSFR